MELQNQHSFFWLRTIRPYLIISLAGVLAFAPISFMTHALKNDILMLEFPINYYISQCIHNGEIPYWFNTWGMGFPLQSNLTWGIFSTPQLIFCSVFNYNIYVLHLEFIFFVLLSGWGMFQLLKKYFLKDENIALLLSVCYMLSGFMVGSTQWLLYITAAAFVPLLISSLLTLLSNPTFKNALRFSIVYVVMFTSVYAAFNIITTYGLALFLLFHFVLTKQPWPEKRKSILYLLTAGLLTLVLCFPCFYFTIELLQNIERGNAINTNSDFFNSNFLHPAALSSMLFPFSSVKMNFANTEGTMLNSYAGLYVLLSIPAAILLTLKEKKRSALILFSAAVLLLLISFGNFTPFRNVLNSLPGFSYFRNPGLFRFYFITSLILFIAVVFQKLTLNDLFYYKSTNRIFRTTAWLLLAICVAVFIVTINSLHDIRLNSVGSFVKKITYSPALLISATIQALLLSAILYLHKKKRVNSITFILITDLVFNTLFCTPFFSVSSYSLKETNAIFQGVKGFPVQADNTDDVPAVFIDTKSNHWYNINVYSKKISANSTYRGPLTLKSFVRLQENRESVPSSFHHQPVFIAEGTGHIQTLLQKPTHVQAAIDFSTPGNITLLQNYFTGWKAYYNNKPVAFTDNTKPGLTVEVPAGKAIVDFIYERKAVWISASVLHLIVLIFLFYCLTAAVRKIFFKASSPSSPL